MQGRGMKSDAGHNKCNIIQFVDQGKELGHDYPTCMNSPAEQQM